MKVTVDPPFHTDITGDRPRERCVVLMNVDQQLYPYKSRMDYRLIQ